MMSKNKIILVNLQKNLFLFSNLIIVEMLLTMTGQRDVQEEYLHLRGQMLYVHEWKAIIYLATPM